MPSDQSYIEQAEQAKTTGNSHFQNKEWSSAVASYSQGLVALDRCIAGLPKDAFVLQATILSNRAMCCLNVMQYQNCIDDCTKAFRITEEHPQADLPTSLLCKLWFRRAKALWMTFTIQSATQDQQEKHDDDTKKHDLLQDAAKDLLRLLQYEPKNKQAQDLLQTIRMIHKTRNANQNNSPVAKIMKELQQRPSQKEATALFQKLLALLNDDLIHVSMELPFDIFHQLNYDSHGVILVLSRAAQHPAFCQAHFRSPDAQAWLNTRVQQAAAAQQTDVLISCLALWSRICLHVDRDDEANRVVLKESYVQTEFLEQSCRAVLDSLDSNGADQTNELIVRAVLDVLSIWTCGTERYVWIRSSLDHYVDPTLPNLQPDTRTMTAPELAVHRKHEMERKTRDQAWAYERSRQLLDVDSQLRQTLFRVCCAPEAFALRRELIVVVGRWIRALEAVETENTQRLLAPLLESPKIQTISEVDDEDEKTEDLYSFSSQDLHLAMQHGLLTAAILMVNTKELSAWALSAWQAMDVEIPAMIRSEHTAAMHCASEVLSGASTIETARGQIAQWVDGGTMTVLMQSPYREIKGGAAACIAKLGLSDKETGDYERMGLLVAACDLLEDIPDDETKVDGKSGSDKKKSLTSAGTPTTATMERGIEMISYLVAHTDMKEELAAGFQSSGASRSALDRLVQLCDQLASNHKNANTTNTTSAFAIANLFQLMCVTQVQMRREAFEGKEVTMEQYDELQKMGKTEEEKDLLEMQKDTDTPEACRERIRKCASAQVPRALVGLSESTLTSETTLEQIVTTWMRMAEEASVRGLLIQQGVLSRCIALDKTSDQPSTTLVNTLRKARHVIAKLLITTNPSLLTAAQRLGCIKPLIALVRDIHSKDLQQFEALLSLTNLASSGQDAQNRVISENGLASLHYAQFSDHTMVQRAATEALCNLVPHEKMLKHLQENANLWLALAADYEDPEKYECARAAAGCLAMATQEDYSVGTLNPAIVELEHFEQNMESILESGRLEIMYRGLVLLLNLTLTLPSIEKLSKLIVFCRAFCDNFHSQSEDELDFPPEEKALLPVAIEIAQKIVRSAEEKE